MPKKEYEWHWGKPPPSIGEHSKVKHLIYHDYIYEYIKTLNQNPLIPKSKLTIIDGFAGGGHYLDNGKDYQGSPIKIWQAMCAAEQDISNSRDKGFELNKKLYLVESNKHNFNYLKNYLTQHDLDKHFDKELSLIRDNFTLVLNRIIDEVRKSSGSSRSIFLLDQYGYSSVPFKYLAMIFDLLPDAEIILTFSIDDLISYIPYKESASSGQEILFEKKEYLHDSPEASFRQFVGTCNKVGLDAEIIRNIRENEENFTAFIQKYISEMIVKISGVKHYNPFMLSRPDSGGRRMMLMHLANSSEAISVMKSLYLEYANNSDITINHKGYLDMDILGFNSKDKMPLFDSNYNFLDREQARVYNALLESIPASIYGQSIDVRDFYNQNASNIITNKDGFLDVIDRLLECKEIEIIERKTNNNKPAPRASKVQLGDTIRIAKQANLYLPPKFK